MTPDITQLAQSEINDALAQLKQISEYPTPSTQYALVLRKYITSQAEALEKAQRANEYLREQSAEWERKAISNFEDCAELSARVEELESQRKLAFTASNRWADKFREAEKRIAELENNEIQEEGNQFLVVRHPGKVPVIKHPVGELEDYLRQIFKADPLATIDIVTHRYYGVGGQFVEDADEYLHEMSINVEQLS